MPTCYSLPCSPDESLDLCSRVWIFWMAQHLNSQHVRGQCRAESQQANYDNNYMILYESIYIYYMPCSQALVLAVPTAGINWQIGPCDRRNEWVGGTSALSNIKLMGRTIGASTALCMTAAKHSQVSLPSSWNSNFQTEQAQIPNNLVPSGLRRWLRYRRKRAWRSQLAWFTCGKLFPPLEEIKYAKVRKDIISWCCNNWVEFGNKHVQLHISKYKSIVY